MLVSESDPMVIYYAKPSSSAVSHRLRWDQSISGYTTTSQTHRLIATVYKKK